MATTEVYTLLVHWIGDDHDCTEVYTGWTEEAAWAAFLRDQRSEIEQTRNDGGYDRPEDYDRAVAECASREAFEAAYGRNDVYIRCDVFHLPA